MLTIAQLFLEFIEFVWPFHRVEQWQRGVILFCGRYWMTVGPGVYLLPWWFVTLHPIDVVPDTPLPITIETITTKDGATITYGVLFEFEVIDATAAYIGVVDHELKARRDAWGITADTLSDLPEGRLDPEAQRALRRTCKLEINKKLDTYGMRCNSVTFTTFVRNMKSYRLFTGE